MAEVDDWEAVDSGGVDDWQDVSTKSAPVAEEIPGADFARSMAIGSSIGESIPGGKTLGDIGSKIGSGIVAATTTMPGEGYFDRLGQNYDQGQEAMAAADRERAAIDAQSPMAMGTKEVLGSLAMMPAQRMAKPVIQTGQFRYPGDSTGEKLKMYLQQKMARDPSKAGAGMGQKVMSEAAQMGETMLPNSVQMALYLARKFKK